MTWWIVQWSLHHWMNYTIALCFAQNKENLCGQVRQLKGERYILLAKYNNFTSHHTALVIIPISWVEKLNGSYRLGTNAITTIGEAIHGTVQYHIPFKIWWNIDAQRLIDIGTFSAHGEWTCHWMLPDWIFHTVGCTLVRGFEYCFWCFHGPMMAINKILYTHTHTRIFKKCSKEIQSISLDTAFEFYHVAVKCQ